MRVVRRISTLTGDVIMLAGAGAALAGLYLLAGLGWVLLIGGLLVAGSGVLLDVGWFSRER